MESYDLSQGVILHTASLRALDSDAPAWVEMPFGPDININADTVNGEIAQYGLELIDPDEDPPEVRETTLVVWCRNRVAVMEGAA